MSFRREKSCRRKKSYVFVMKTYTPNLQEAISSREEPSQKKIIRFRHENI
jgi:hypothetical protein